MRNQGLAVVELNDNGLMVMLPDGSIEAARDGADVLRRVRRWAQAEADRSGASKNWLKLEWRGGAQAHMPVEKEASRA